VLSYEQFLLKKLTIFNSENRNFSGYLATDFNKLKVFDYEHRFFKQNERGFYLCKRGSPKTRRC